ncbi:hypothetical protein VDGD_05273 [Verticillium dahliae]|uniref:Protein kinase domain-containing protein n=1 Tax=Verticillium dahliae (strain VdLs.17 / ATCC MYA-4575 / FGSC 10137) TaxID=498257 RepID=G2X541_VERDV|nr:uncharacterized protein VDAG_05273 [Verticillium dahliae VdLs.17]EGY23835.1 hypothetical protein VDAG_05273 [Verticillium dahliae VdLs.17]RBQ92986.1 hypothetical protein VDGD_05273 [Verticillium dahliae]
MEEELASLRQQLREEQRRREEEQRRREEAEGRILEEQRRREEEQRRREEAEELARPLALEKYLEACHSLNHAIQVVTDRSLTTQGDTTNPTGRIFPSRIIPWDDFATKQEETWDQLSAGQSFASHSAFPSRHQLEYVRSLLKPISSEIGLRDFERDVVENAVQKLVDEAYRDPRLRTALSLQGTVTFESHTNLGRTDDPISAPMEHMSIGEGHAAAAASAPRPPAPKPRRRARGKGNRADQFCIYRTSDGRNIPALAIEYKAPHKLSTDEVVTGLESEIQPARDVINKDGEGFSFASRSLAAAVITQLFSYMIGKGIQYGYVCTGETFIFLYIPDDPTIVYYSVCVPNVDVLDDDENRLHRTAAAQVFAFILRALCATPPPLSWHDAAAGLDTWAVEYDDVLRNIPETMRKDKGPRASPYKPQRWRGFKRSPIQTRSRCQPPHELIDGRGDDDDEEAPPSPTPKRPSRSKDKATMLSAGADSGSKRKQPSGGNRQHGQMTQQKIQDRPFCTQRCLLGLASDGPMDESCPNFGDHGSQHISRLEFLRLIRAQLAKDRGPDADCIPLYMSGSVGSLFKVRLSSHGYTLVAKGVEGLDLVLLRHENDMYDRVRAIQGKHVPVCLGRIELILPYYYDSGVFEHFLFLSWAGRPVFECCDQTGRQAVVDAVTAAFTEIHKLKVLHRDGKPRNVLYDAGSSQIMIVDFERAELRNRQPLGPISLNGQPRKRKRKAVKTNGSDPFAMELRSVVECVSGLAYRVKVGDNATRNARSAATKDSLNCAVPSPRSGPAADQESIGCAAHGLTVQ